MNDRDRLASSFEVHRGHLQAIAYRMLGSLPEAEDAVQETWLRLERADAPAVQNLGGWLTTVVSRVCLDMLRARASRREALGGQLVPGEGREPAGHSADPEQEALLADSAGRALLVVLDKLEPDERVAFVLHDVFGVPFGELAPIVARTPATAKKLASRARLKVRGTPAVSTMELARNRQVVEAFLAASRAGDLDAILTLLAPDVVRRADQAALAPGRPAEARGARRVAEEVTVFGANARFAEPILVDGAVGVVVAPRGRMLLAIAFSIEAGVITGYDLIGDPGRLAQLDLAVLGPWPSST